MLKNLLAVTLGLIISLVFVATVHAAGVSIRLGQPKTPTNQNTFDINFVTLDVDSSPIVVKCFKKGPSDGGFSQFGADINLAAGGNTGNCAVGGSIVNSDGSYQFQTTANNGLETVSSNIITIEYKTGGPGTPTNYSKEKISPCVYRVKFRSANDDGKTTKVEVYRSENTSFNADSGSRIATVSISSNTDGNADVNSPDCNKEYFFVVRAFDSAGNGSGLIGDSKTVTVTTTTTSAGTSTVPAIATGVTGGDVLGDKSQEKDAGEVMAEATREAEELITPGLDGDDGAGDLLSARNVIILLAIIAAIVFGILLSKRKQKSA